MDIDKSRLATVELLRPALTKAIERLDSAGISRVLHDPAIERIEFAPGVRYRLAVVGSPVDPTPELPKFGDSPKTQITKLLGWDAGDAIADASLLEVTGIYRGRLPMAGFPHAFTMLNGRAMTLADMDIVGWEIAQ